MGKSRCTNLATVRAVGAVGNKVYSHFSFGSLNRGVGLARWNGVALREELRSDEMNFKVMS